MWISKHRWARLSDRLDELQDRVTQLEYGTRFYSDMTLIRNPTDPKYSAGIKDALHAIASRIGVEIKVPYPSTAKVELITEQGDEA